MDLQRAVQDVLLGSALAQVAAAFRQDLIAAFDFRPDEVYAETFADETATFMRKVARKLGDEHTGRDRVGAALCDWVQQVDHYEAWDALLSGFEFEGKEQLIRRGRRMFPGPLTAHWRRGGEEV